MASRTWAGWAGVLLCAVLAGCGQAGDGDRIDGVSLSRVDPSHEHTTSRQEYQERPPVGGPHWPPQAGGVYGWLRCGVYDEPVPDEFAVHSLEHGAVWLTYLPGSAREDVAALLRAAEGHTDYVLASPYPGQDAPFQATAWGAQLAVDDPSDPRLQQFVERYAGGDQGGEPGADCANGTSPEDAREALAGA